jgi:hypothetical protein
MYVIWPARHHDWSIIRYNMIIWPLANTVYDRIFGDFTAKNSVCTGLARTAYMHRIWPYIWYWVVFLPKKCIYTVYIWLLPALHTYTLHTWSTLFFSHVPWQVAMVKPQPFCKRKLSKFLQLAKYPSTGGSIPLMYPICESFRLNIQVCMSYTQLQAASLRTAEFMSSTTNSYVRAS